MANRYWFRPKTIGYGVTPVSWEGWLCALAYCGVVLGCFLAGGLNSENIMIVAAFIAIFIIASIAMVFIARAKTDVSGIGASASVSNDWNN